MNRIEDVLTARPCPGHGILLGSARHPTWNRSVCVYFITGQDKYVLREAGTDCLCTTLSGEVLYAPVRMERAYTVVSNGVQSDAVRDALARDMRVCEALSFCGRREHWDLIPSYGDDTSRISGVKERNGNFTLSIVKNDSGRLGLRQFFYQYRWSNASYFLSTLQGDGGSAPFSGEPVPVLVEASSAQLLAGQIWDSLKEETRVALFVRYVDQRNGFPETVILNKYGPCTCSAPKAAIWPGRKEQSGRR